MPTIVFVRLPNYIGDAVMALPALRLLEQQGLKPHLLGKLWMNDLFAALPWPRTVLPRKLNEQTAVLRSLRDQNAMTGLLLTNSLSSAWVFWRAGIKAVGYAKELRSPLLQTAVALDDSVHQALQYVKLAAVLTGAKAVLPQDIEWPISGADRQRADDLLRQYGIAAPFVMICPFAGGNFRGREKVWPEFAAFVKALADTGVRVVCCPGPGAETAAARALDQRLIVLPDTNLRDFIGLAARAAVTVSNDSGPAHLAAAAGCRVVSVLRWPDQLTTVRPLSQRSVVVMSEDAWPGVADVLAATQTQLGAG
jgi:heptosyltransferase II